MGKKELLDWIKKTKEEGHSESEIYDTLKSNGYNQIEIQDAMSEAFSIGISSTTSSISVKEKPANNKIGIILYVIAIILIIIVGAFFLYYYHSEENKNQVRNMLGLPVVPKIDDNVVSLENVTQIINLTEIKKEEIIIQDCGVSGVLINSTIYSLSKNYDFKSDRALSCIGEAIINNCTNSRVGIRDAFFGEIYYEIQNDPKGCFILITYGNEEQILSASQKEYANKNVICMINKSMINGSINNKNITNASISNGSASNGSAINKSTINFGALAFEIYRKASIESLSNQTQCVGTLTAMGKYININRDICFKDSECDDNKTSTRGICSGTPKNCTFVNITDCLPDDGYCPKNCTYNKGDNDCQNLNKCKLGFDCHDNNACTIDICKGDPKACVYDKIVNCTTGDECCPAGCSYAKDADCDQCTNDAGCNDNIASTEDDCKGTPKRCEHKTITKCDDDDGYCPPGCMKVDDNNCSV